MYSICMVRYAICNSSTVFEPILVLAKINNCMKAVTKRNKLVGDIGDLMLAYVRTDVFCEIEIKS